MNMKIKNKITVLYVCLDETLGGSTQSLLDLIESISPEIEPIVIVPRLGLAYEEFISRGIECHIYPFIKLFEIKKNKLFDVIRYPWRWHIIKKNRFDYGCCRYIKKKLKGRKIDIVHSNTTPNDIGVLLAKKFNAKHVWHIREYCDLHFNFEIYGGITRLQKLINAATARVAISTAVKNHWKLTTDNTWILHDAVCHTSEICYQKIKEKFILFSAYNLTEAKGTRNAINAFAKSGLKNNGYKLKLMGNCDDSYRKSLLETISINNLTDAVEFIPFQKDIKPFFSVASAYIMASEYEGLGRVTAEAMFYGCPVIAYASGGTLDLVKDGVTGYLYNNIGECAKIMNEVCFTDQETIIIRAQNFVKDSLSHEIYGPKILDIYKTILQ